MKIRNYLLGLSVMIFAFAVIFLTNDSFQKHQKYSPRKSNAQENVQGIKGAQEWLNKIRNDPATGTIDIKDVLKARKQVRYLAQHQSKALGLTWEEMGPDNVGGRTRAILFDQNNPTIMFTGGVSGGLWKSTTSGSSWVMVADISENLAVSCIAQGSDGKIYVGTGEGLASPPGINVGSGTIGGGLYISNTSGQNFTLSPNTIPASNNAGASWAEINRIAIDPVNPNRVYAALGKGLMVSDDAGINWFLPKYLISGIYVFLQGDATDVKVASDGTVVCAVSSKCYVSPNGNDETYLPSATGMTTSSALSRIEIAISPQDPNIIYILAAANDGSLDNVYRSNNKGQSWYIIGPGGSTNFEVFGSNSQGYYDNVIAVHPNDSNKIILGGINMWEGYKVTPNGFFHWTQKTFGGSVHVDHHCYTFHPTNPNIYYLGTDGGLFRTLDGGQTFQAMNKNLNITQFYSVACSGTGEVAGGTQDNSTPFIDLQGNTPQNAEVLYFGDGGWVAFSLINQEVMFATSQYGNIGRTPDKGENFQLWPGWLSGRMLDGNNVDFGASFVTPFLLWESFNDENSTDSVSFVASANYAPGTLLTIKSKNNMYPFPYTTNTNINQGDTVSIIDKIQAKYFLGITNGVWMTKEALDFSKVPQWYKISNFTGTVQSMAYSTDGDVLFVGTLNGSMNRISNINAAYDSITADVTSPGQLIQTDLINQFSRPITSISVDPKNANRVVVTLGGYGNYSSWVYYCNNALSGNPNFIPKQGNLPDMPVYASVIEMNNTSHVIIGTEYGMFATENINIASPEWAQENNGMDNVPAFMIRQQTSNNPGASYVTIGNGDTITTHLPGVTNYGVIYVGTHGRGIFQCKDYVGIKEFEDKISSNKPSLTVYPNPAADYLTISFKLKKSAEVNIKVYDMNGRVVKLVDLSRKGVGNHKYEIDCTDLSKGTYFIRLLTEKESVISKFIVL